MNIILYAIPVFFILIAVELIADRVRNTHFYRLNDAITSLSIGGLSRVIGVMKNLVPFTIYIILYENFAFFDLANTGWMWVLAFVIYDFLYYWNHRFGHEVSLFWAAHVVHHSSEDYNLTTALRQTSGSFFNFVFFLPMAFMGVDPLMLVSVASVNLVYQFWVHTQHVGKLGFIEWFMVTPSNHRVHHAQNQIYLDRNYGGVFIIWDRLFGSFQEELEDEKPIYGVRKALKSWNPFYANIQVYKQLAHDSYHTKKSADKIKVWLGRTGWRPTDVAEKYPLAKADLTQFIPYQTNLSVLTKVYSISQYIMISVLAIYLMINASSLSIGNQLTLAFSIIFASVNLAWMMENKLLALWLEWVKHTLTLGVLIFLIQNDWALYLTVPIILCMLLLSIIHMKRDDEKSTYAAASIATQASEKSTTNGEYT